MGQWVRPPAVRRRRLETTLAHLRVNRGVLECVVRPAQPRDVLGGVVAGHPIPVVADGPVDTALFARSDVGVLLSSELSPVVA